MRSESALSSICRTCISLVVVAWIFLKPNDSSFCFVQGFQLSSGRGVSIWNSRASSWNAKKHPDRHLGRTFSSPGSLPKENEPRKRLVELIPSGRVKDPDSWLRMCSDSLERLTGKPMTSYMEGVESIDDVHGNTRYSFLSHGSQDDPVYCYFNQAALNVFQYPESEIYQLPSRYCTRQGIDRSQRQAIIESTADGDAGVYLFRTGARVTKNGDLMELRDILLWNVYDDEGFRVGQAAIYDNDTIVYLGKEEEGK